MRNISPPTGTRSPDRLARIVSLHRLSYPGTQTTTVRGKNKDQLLLKPGGISEHSSYCAFEGQVEQAAGERCYEVAPYTVHKKHVTTERISCL